MKLHYGLDNLEQPLNAVVTSGTFDGVHLGHKVILDRLKEIASSANGESTVITFWPHPRYVLSGKSDFKLLSTIDEKIDLLSKMGIDHLVIIPFTKAFSELSSRDFVQQILVGIIGTRKLVIGYDHKFGRNQEGSFEYLKENAAKFHFDVEEIPQHEVDEVGISSTKIRESLIRGDVKEASKHLGNSYTLTGKVVIGQQLGRKIGFPTCNLEVGDANKLIPADGVYAVRVKFKNQQFNGMMNIGYRPTVNGQQRSLEVHIFNFHEEIYRKMLKVEFIDQVRSEIKFESVDELKSQLIKDKEQVQNILKNDYSV